MAVGRNRAGNSREGKAEIVWMLAEDTDEVDVKVDVTVISDGQVGRGRFAEVDGIRRCGVFRRIETGAGQGVGIGGCIEFVGGQL